MLKDLFHKQTVQRLQQCALVGLGIVLSGCVALPIDTQDYQLLTRIQLPPDLDEASGLYCEGNRIFTVSDSGNLPHIVELNPGGQVIRSIVLNTTNTDWEALSGNDNQFVIADVGNNSGARTDLSLVAVDRQSQALTRISLDIEDYTPDEHKVLEHDYDFEALVRKGDQTYLFSKSWRTGVVRVYQWTMQDGTTSLQPSISIDGLPGVVTGGDYDEATNQFVLAGYRGARTQLFRPYIALLDPDLSINRIIELDGMGQVEGVCMQGQEVWLAQERSVFSGAQLIHLRIHERHTEPADTQRIKQ